MLTKNQFSGGNFLFVWTVFRDCNGIAGYMLGSFSLVLTLQDAIRLGNDIYIAQNIIHI